jgi:hypothetical protein
MDVSLPQTNINKVALVIAEIAVLFAPLRKLAIMGLVGKVVYDEINSLYKYQGTLDASSIIANVTPIIPISTTPTNVNTATYSGVCSYGCGI